MSISRLLLYRPRNYYVLDFSPALQIQYDTVYTDTDNSIRIFLGSDVTVNIKVV